MRVDQYADSDGGVYNVKISIGNSKTVYTVVNEDDDLIDVAKNFCDLHKLDSNQHKDIANKLREAIQMRAIGMSEIYEEAITESDNSPLLKSAEKLVEALAKKRRQALRQPAAKTSTPRKPKAPSKAGADLYAREMARKAAWEARRQSMNEEAKRKEMEGVTFAPKLDAVTRVMAKHMPRLENRMSERVVKAKAKMEVLRKSTVEEQNDKFTFKPIINPSYCSMMKGRSIRNSYKNVFDDLYGDSRRRSSARVARSVSSLTPDHTFRPDINLSQKEIEGSNRVNQAKKNPLFDEEPLVDPKTKQPLFVPMINKDSSTRRRKDTESIEKYLSLSKKPEQNVSAKKTPASNPRAPRLVPKKKTTELISGMRSATFAAIFALLDPDNTGVVHTDRMHESSNITCNGVELPKDVLDVYKVLFAKKEITLQEFMEESNKLFDKLSINQRNALFSFARSQTKLNKSKSEKQFAFTVLFASYQ